jgi:hypothetical protein
LLNSAMCLTLPVSGSMITSAIFPSESNACELHDVLETAEHSILFDHAPFVFVWYIRVSEKPTNRKVSLATPSFLSRSCKKRGVMGTFFRSCLGLQLCR